MCTCRPSSRTFGYADRAANQQRASSMLTPNLFSDLPVEIFSWVCASTSGLMRTAAAATTCCAWASRCSVCSSSSDSTLKREMPTLSAPVISSTLLPTPENTIRPGGMPACRLRCSSPADTMSAPTPASAISCRMARFGLALTAKQIPASRPASACRSAWMRCRIALAE